MARARSWARLEAAIAAAPAPYQRLTITNRIVAPNPVQGEPPVDLGVFQRHTTQPYGWPTIDEKWDPFTLDAAAPLTESEVARFNDVLGITRQRTAQAASQAFYKAAGGAYIWRNHPDGAMIVHRGSDGTAFYTPLSVPVPPPPY